MCVAGVPSLVLQFSTSVIYMRHDDVQAFKLSHGCLHSYTTDNISSILIFHILVVNTYKIL